MGPLLPRVLDFVLKPAALMLQADELKFNFARVSAQSFAVRGKTQKNIYKEPVSPVARRDVWRTMPSDRG